MNFEDIKSRLIRCVMPDINWEVKTKTSVKGLFGTGCFISWVLAAGEFCQEKRSPRKIGTCIGTGFLFGAAYLYIDKRDKKHELDLAGTKHPATSSSGTPNSSSQIPPQTIPPKTFVIGQHHEHIDYDKRQLVGRLIGVEDICIIYCETGVGKSVLSFQIANDIAKGQYSSIQPDDMGLHEPQLVLLYDCELKEDDYCRRYPEYEQPANLQILIDGFFNEVQDWLKDIEQRLFELGTDVTVILDNITGAFRSLTAEEMRRFIEVSLSQLQEKAATQGFHITFIIIAHTNKEGLLGGSMNFQNFATTIIHLKPGPDEYHNEMEIDKCRNYGEMRGKHFLLHRSEVGFKHFELEAELDAKPAQPTAPVKSVIPVTPKSPKYPRLTETQVEEMRKRVDAGEQKKVIAAAYGIPDSYVDRYLEGKTKPVHDGDNTGDNKEETDE